jgi:hypothetical protein
MGDYVADIASVIVGGLLAIGGGGVTQWMLHHVKTMTELQQKRAVKFEELVAAIYEFDHWLDVKRNRVVFGEDKPETASPYAKVYAITAVYFPQFNDRVSELQRAALKFESWMFSKGKQRLANKMDKLGEGFEEAYAEFGDKHFELRKELLAYADKEFKSDAGIKWFWIK